MISHGTRLGPRSDEGRTALRRVALMAVLLVIVGWQIGTGDERHVFDRIANCPVLGMLLKPPAKIERHVDTTCRLLRRAAEGGAAIYRLISEEDAKY